MIPPVLLYLAAAVLRIVAAIARPRVATCPSSFYVDGVRPSGVTSCVSTYDPRPEDTKAACHHAALDVPRLPVRVWCARGEVAIVVDARTVACRRAAT